MMVYNTVLCLPLVVWCRSCSRKEPSGLQRCSILLWLDIRNHPGFPWLTRVQPHRVTTAHCHPHLSKPRTQVCISLLWVLLTSDTVHNHLLLTICEHIISSLPPHKVAKQMVFLKSELIYWELCVSTDSNLNIVADLGELGFRAISPALSNPRGSQCSQVNNFLSLQLHSLSLSFSWYFKNPLFLFSYRSRRTEQKRMFAWSSSIRSTTGNWSVKKKLVWPALLPPRWTHLIYILCSKS